MTRILSSFADVSQDYDVIFCDLWGCLHNGIHALQPAVDVLVGFRKAGGRVVLLTNASRPNRDVAKLMAKYGVPPEAYDFIVSSGDAAQEAALNGEVGRRVYHIGLNDQHTFFFHADGSPLDMTHVPLDEAESIICTGLRHDRTETPEDYRKTFERGVELGLPMHCINPDLIVDIGDTRVYCAGALAVAYTEAGGESLYYGKPHRPIYDLARKRLADMFGPEAGARIVCVGDGINTDIHGGMENDLASIFITGGLAAKQTGTLEASPDAEMLAAFLADAGRDPTYSLGFLR